MKTKTSLLLSACVLTTSLALGSCGKDNGSTTTTTTTTSSETTSQQVGQDLRRAGENIEDAAKTAASQARPALERAGEETKQAVHNAAQRIAERTAPTEPATQP